MTHHVIRGKDCILGGEFMHFGTFHSNLVMIIPILQNNQALLIRTDRLHGITFVCCN